MNCPKCLAHPMLIKYGMCLKCYMNSKIDEADKKRETIKELTKTKRAKPRNLESNLQISCVNWFNYQYPSRVIFSIPNGGSRNAIEAKRLKAEGVMSGVADLFIMESNNSYHGLFIELKYGNTNNQSENQIEFEKLCIDRDYLYTVARSFEDFNNIVTKYFKS